MAAKTARVRWMTCPGFTYGSAGYDDAKGYGFTAGEDLVVTASAGTTSFSIVRLSGSNEPMRFMKRETSRTTPYPTARSCCLSSDAHHLS